MSFLLFSLYSLFILNQETTQSFSQEEYSWTLGSRGILVRQAKPNHLVALKPTGAF